MTSRLRETPVSSPCTLPHFHSRDAVTGSTTNRPSKKTGNATTLLPKLAVVLI